MNIKNKLKELEKNGLINLIIELSKIDKKNKFYLELKLNNNIKDYFEYSKKRIDEAFCCLEKINYKKSREVINEFKKIINDKEKLLEIYIFYFEKATKFDNDWRIEEKHFLAKERIFRDIINLVNNNKNLKNKYIKKIKKLTNVIEGWGHKENINLLFDEIK